MKLIGIISSVFTLIFLIINRGKPLALNLSDAAFLLSLVYLLLSMVIYIRNVGLFKTFAYNSYRKTVRKKNKKDKEKNKEANLQARLDEKIEGIDPRDEDMLEFHEFVEQKYSVRWSSRNYIIAALAFYLLSYVFSYFL